MQSAAAPPEWAQQIGADTVLRLHVRPGAKRPGVLGVHGSRLKIAIAAPPIEGKANEALIELLADLLDLPQRQLHLQSGAASRDKAIRIEGVRAEAVVERLQSQK